MPTKKKAAKHPKMDKLLVSKLQKHELDYIIKRAGKDSTGRKVNRQALVELIKAVGRSRAKIYRSLRAWGFTIKTRKYKS